MECRAGEVHAVVGENGSGKSTLLGIASGVSRARRGRRRDRRAAAARCPRPPRRCASGLGMAYQTSPRCSSLSVAENLFLAAPPDERPRFREMASWAARQAAAVRRPGIARRPDRRVSPSASGSSSRSSRRCSSNAEGAAPRRADHRARAGGGGASPPARRRPCGRGRRYRLRQPPAAGGARDRSPGDGATGRHVPGDTCHLRDGGAAPRGTDDRAVTQACVPASQRERRAEGGAAGDRRAPRPPIRSARSDPAPRRDPRDRRRRGQRPGRDPAVSRRREQGRRNDQVQRSEGRTSSSPYATLAAGIMLLSGDRMGESLFPVLGVRSNSSIQVLRRFSKRGWLRRGKEQVRGRGNRPAVEGANPVDRAAGALSLRRQPAKGRFSPARS